jgi:DNA-binding transcriptional LysR family regulator
MRRYPGLRIDLTLEDRMIDLALEGADVAIRVGAAPPDSTSLIAHELSSFRRILVASPDYLKRRGEPRTPEALAKHDVLSFSARAWADVWGLANEHREAQVRLNVVFRSNALHAVRHLAITGSGVALLPEWLVRKDVEERTLRVVLRGWQSEPVSVSAIHRTEHRGSARVRALIEHLRAQYAAGMASSQDAV